MSEDPSVNDEVSVMNMAVVSATRSSPNGA